MNFNFVPLFLLVQIGTVSAQLTSSDFYRTILPKEGPKPELDSTLPVQHLSAPERVVLFKKLLAADQKYREELQKSARTFRDKTLWKRVEANDRANQAILLRYVRAHGWPTRRLGGKDTPFTAWLIVWHCNRFETYRNFEPFLRAAAQRKLIPPNHYSSLAQKMARLELTRPPMPRSLLPFLFPLLLVSDHFNDDRVQQARTEKGRVVDELLQTNALRNISLNLFFRAFKQESELEIWGKNEVEPTFRLLKTYPVCAKSGTLGPKRRQGDEQVPEGFYHLDRFNPRSQFYLSLGVNYPNASDRVRGDRGNLGGDIFIHGSCVTVGCLPMTDAGIKEIYLLALAAREAGQARIPVHIFPARLDEAGFAELKKRYPGQPELLRFWGDLKAGYDFFEDKKRLPKVRVDGSGRYRIVG